MSESRIKECDLTEPASNALMVVCGMYLWFMLARLGTMSRGELDGYLPVC